MGNNMTDVDAMYTRALDAGHIAETTPEDAFWGEATSTCATPTATKSASRKHGRTLKEAAGETFSERRTRIFKIPNVHMLGRFVSGSLPVGHPQ